MATIEEVIKVVHEDFSWSERYLKENYKFVNVEDVKKELYWDNRGIYVLDEENKIIYYTG